MDLLLDFLSNIAWWGWILIALAIVAIRDIFFSKSAYY